MSVAEWEVMPSIGLPRSQTYSTPSLSVQRRLPVRVNSATSRSGHMGRASASRPSVTPSPSSPYVPRPAAPVGAHARPVNLAFGTSWADAKG